MTCAFTCGPIAPQRNPAIREDYYSPQKHQIVSIVSNSFDNTQITTSNVNEFVLGQQVRFVIPSLCGMQELNGKSCYITQIVNPQTFIIDFDARYQDAFNPTGNPNQYPFVLPIGDINSGPINSDGRINNLTYINGSFINVG